MKFSVTFLFFLFLPMMFTYGLLAQSLTGEETANSAREYVLGVFVQSSLEDRISEWWGYPLGAIEVVKTESGRLDISTIYDRVREDDPLVGDIAETVVEGLRQGLKDACYNWGANFDLRLCEGEKNYIYLKGLPNTDERARVVCQTNTVPGRELSIKLSWCNIFVPTGEETFSRHVFQAYNTDYSGQRELIATRTELEEAAGSPELDSTAPEQGALAAGADALDLDLDSNLSFSDADPRIAGDQRTVLTTPELSDLGIQESTEELPLRESVIRTGAAIVCAPKERDSYEAVLVERTASTDRARVTRLEGSYADRSDCMTAFTDQGYAVTRISFYCSQDGLAITPTGQILNDEDRGRSCGGLRQGSILAAVNGLPWLWSDTICYVHDSSRPQGDQITEIKCNSLIDVVGPLPENITVYFRPGYRGGSCLIGGFRRPRTLGSGGRECFEAQEEGLWTYGKLHQLPAHLESDQ